MDGERGLRLRCIRLFQVHKVREGRLRPDLLWSHLTVSLDKYDTLMYDIPMSHLFTDIMHINRHKLILGRTGHQK